jgi:glycosyltransferase 2 family protein
VTGGTIPRRGVIASRAARWGLRLFVSAGLIGLLLWILPFDQVRSAAAQMTLPLYAGALAAFLGAHFLGALKWRAMMTASLGGERLAIPDMVACYGAGLFSNLFLPTVVGGDVVRAGMAARALGRPEAIVLGSVADRLIDIAGLALLVGGGVIFAGAELTSWGAPFAGLVVILVLGTAFLLMPLALRRPLTAWPAGRRRRIGRSLVALRHLSRRPRPALLALVLSLSMQSIFIVVSAWLGHAVGAEAPLWAWFIAWPLAKAAGMLPVSLGGLGVRDAALASLLVPFGVPAAIGLVASLAWNAVLIGGALIGGLLGLLLRPRPTDRASGVPAATSPVPHPHVSD